MRTRPEPKTYAILSSRMVTPNMLRVSVGGEALADFPADQQGGYLKLRLPGDTDKPVVRTYTIRHQSPEALDIDFALHGEGGAGGPAVSWAQNVRPGDRITAGGPGPAKPLPTSADWYLIAGDMTALPAIAVNLEALPEDATGHAVIEVQAAEDRQYLSCPPGITIDWLVNPEPGKHPERFAAAVRSAPWREGRVYAWCATEFEAMRLTRQYLREERGLGPAQLYISSYWKLGLGEEKHREIKRADATTVA